jgi:hypothetical protein
VAGLLYDFAPWQPYVASALLCVAAAGFVVITSDTVGSEPSAGPVSESGPEAFAER